MGTGTPKLTDIKQLFILGDSYSDVGWRLPGCALPTEESPMGIDDPCKWVTWCVPARWQDNWVQHLSRDRQAAGHDMRIYDFAQGGSTLDDVLEQSEAMSKLLRDRVVDLDADKAVLVVWVGVNDVCLMDEHGIPRAMTGLADVLSRCYDAGHRHLVLFDVPPRTKPKPYSGEPIIRNRLMKNIGLWNTALQGPAAEWKGKAGTSLKLFSASDVFDDIMDRPEQHGFTQRDTYTSGGGIWADHVHPTEAVHKVVFEAFKARMQKDNGRTSRT